MEPHESLAVLTALLVVLAGCSALSGSDDPDVPEGATLTPVSVSPEPAPTATPLPQSPFWLASNGTVAVGRLQEAHGAVLENRPYAWTLIYRVSQHTGPTRTFVQRVATDGDAVRIERAGPIGNRSLYADKSGGYVRFQQNGTEQFGTVADAVETDRRAPVCRLLNQYMAGLNVDVRTVTEDGTTYYRLHAADGVPNVMDDPGSSVRDYSLTSYVTPAGFVRTVIVSFNRVRRERGEHIEIRFDYTAVGEPVERPEWVDRAAASARETAAGTGTPTSDIDARRPALPDALCQPGSS